MKKFINNIWNKLNIGCQALIFTIGFIVVFGTLVTWIIYNDENRIDVYATTLYTFDQPIGMDYPVTLKGDIYYGGHPIVEKYDIIEFRDIKTAKRELKAELKIVQKELRKNRK